MKIGTCPRCDTRSPVDYEYRYKTVCRKCLKTGILVPLRLMLKNLPAPEEIPSEEDYKDWE